MSWYKTGKDGQKYVEEKDKERREAGATNNVKGWRFKMGYGSTGNIVCLDDLTFFFNEHQYEANGSYYNYDTCIQDIEGECPLCESGCKIAPVGVVSIIDLTEYKKKDGTTTSPTKKVMVLKQGGRERYLRKQDKLGGLAYKKFEVYRSNDKKGEATGTDVEYEKDVDPEKLKQLAPKDVNPDEWIQPFDYTEIFKPKTAAQLRAAIGLSEPVGAAESAPADEPTKEPAKAQLKDMI